ncbi:MAG: penicillin acylase family protein, partial [Saprospiraceae bacterium]
MKIIKFLIAFLLTLGSCYYLSKPIVLKKSTIPALGSFLSPFTGFWQNGQSVALIPEINSTAEALKAPAKVLYDKKLVPHIFAENNHDAFFLQGYVTAKHRLWQMDFATRATGGRLAE